MQISKYREHFYKYYQLLEANKEIVEWLLYKFFKMQKVSVHKQTSNKKKMSNPVREASCKLTITQPLWS